MPDFHIPNDPEWQWAYDLILYGVGEEYPEADPTTLRAMGDELYGFANQLRNGVAATANIRGAVSNNLNGPAADAFNNFSGDIAKNVPAGADISTALGGAAYEFALNSENTQYNIVIAAFTQVVQIAIALLTPFGAAAVPGLIKIGQEIVGALIDLLKISLQNALMRLTWEALSEGFEELWQAAAAQVIQILEGNRTGLDYKDLALSFAGGAFIGGGVAGAMIIGGKAFPRLGRSDVAQTLLSAGAETGFESLFNMMLGGNFNPGATFVSSVIGDWLQRFADAAGNQFGPRPGAIPPPPPTGSNGSANPSPSPTDAVTGPPVPSGSGPAAGPEATPGPAPGTGPGGPVTPPDGAPAPQPPPAPNANGPLGPAAGMAPGPVPVPVPVPGSGPFPGPASNGTTGPGLGGSGTNPPTGNAGDSAPVRAPVPDGVRVPSQRPDAPVPRLDGSTPHPDSPAPQPDSFTPRPDNSMPHRDGSTPQTGPGQTTGGNTGSGPTVEAPASPVIGGLPGFGASPVPDPALGTIDQPSSGVPDTSSPSTAPAVVPLPPDQRSVDSPVIPAPTVEGPTGERPTTTAPATQPPTVVDAPAANLPADARAPQVPPVPAPATPAPAPAPAPGSPTPAPASGIPAPSGRSTSSPPPPVQSTARDLSGSSPVNPEPEAIPGTTQHSLAPEVSAVAAPTMMTAPPSPVPDRSEPSQIEVGLSKERFVAELRANEGKKLPVVNPRAGDDEAGGDQERLKAIFRSLAGTEDEYAQLVRDAGPAADAETTPSEPVDPAPPLSDVPPDAVAKSTVETPTCGDPIDVTTGRMIYTETDATLPGLTLERTHRSDYRWGRSFGPSWASTLDQRIVTDDRQAWFLAADGSILTYPLPAEGGETLPVLGRPAPLRRLAGGGWLLTDRDTLLLFAPAPGGARAGEALLRDVVSNGVRWHVERADDGTPTRLVSSTGDTVALRTADGLVTGARFVPADPADGEVELPGFGYDDRRRLVEVRNSSGDPTRLAYDDAGRIVRWEDRNGEWYTYAYDEAGRCVRTDGKGGYLRYTFEYGAQVTVVTDSLGGGHRFELNERRQVVAIVDPLGGVTRAEWDAANRLLSRTDPLGRTTRFEYDERGRPVSWTRPDGSRASVGYDERGRVVSRTGFDGTTHVVEERAVGAADGVPETIFDLDGLGRPRSARLPDGTATSFGWTAEGDLAWRAGPDGATQEWHYDGEGNLVESIDATGRAVRLEYGPFDLPVARIDEAGNRTEFAYDTELRLTAVTNPAGQVWRYAYDAAGRPVEETDFDGRTQRYVHDAAGQLVAHTNPAGETTHYTYDALGRVTERRVGDAVTRLEYDAQGRITTVRSPDAVVRFERDEQGRVIAETINGDTVRTTYHPELGTIEARTMPSGRHSRWTFDAHGRPESLATGRHLVRFGYDRAGREISRTIDDVVALRQRFDAAGRLAAQHIADAAERGFSYDATGRVTAITDSAAGDRSFAADLVGRIRAVATGGTRTERYDYDEVGNLIGAGGGRWEFDGTMLVRTDDAEFEYDEKGRVIGRADPAGTWRFVWDAEDRLVQATTAGGDRWRYRYDGFGRRIAKQRLGDDNTVLEEVRFAWAGDLMVEQSHRGSAGTTTTSWEYRPDGSAPVAQTDGDGLHTIVTDLIGAPTHLVTADGRLRWWSQGNLWGGGHDRAATPLRFPGQYFDAETGLHYNRFRFYDPATARYLSVDPLGLAGGPNPTAYVPDPLTVADPLGLASCKVPQPSLSPNPNGVSNPALPATPDGGPTQLPNRAAPPSPDAWYGSPPPANASTADPSRHARSTSQHAQSTSRHAQDWYTQLDHPAQSPLAQLSSSQHPTLESIQQQLPPLADHGPPQPERSHRGEPRPTARRRGGGTTNRPGGVEIGISKDRLVEELFTPRGMAFPVVNPHAGEEGYLQNCVDSALAMYEILAGHDQRLARPSGPINAESLDRVLDWLSDHRTVDAPDYDTVTRAIADAPVTAQGFLRVTTPDSRDGHMFLVVRSESGPAFINAYDGSVGRLPENPSNLRFSPMHEGIQVTGVDRMETIGTPPEQVGALGMEGEGVDYRLEISSTADEEFANDPLVTSDYVNIVIDHADGKPILEVVTKPMTILPGDADNTHDATATIDAFYDVFRRLRSVPQGGSRSLSALFPGPAYTIEHGAENLRVRSDAPPNMRRLGMQYSVGVPIAGLPRFLAHVAENTFVDRASQSLKDGHGFAEQLAGSTSLTGEERDALVGYLTLVYTQVDAEVSRVRGRGSSLAKNNAAVVSRTALADVRASLPAPVRQFLEDNESAIKEAFHERQEAKDKGYTQAVFDSPLRGEAGITIGDYLSSALSPSAAWISQDRALYVRTEYGLDHGGTPDNPQFDPPLLIVELRSYGKDNAQGTELSEIKARFEALETAAEDAYNHVRGLRGQAPSSRPPAQLEVPGWSSDTAPAGGTVAPADRQSLESIRHTVRMRAHQRRQQMESGQEDALRNFATRVAQEVRAAHGNGRRLQLHVEGGARRFLGDTGTRGQERAGAVWAALQPLLRQRLGDLPMVPHALTSRGDGSTRCPGVRPGEPVDSHTVLIWLSETQAPTGGTGMTLSFLTGEPATVAKSTEETPCVGDPIDVTTGRMILTETDATLPGLTLERTHRSDYRWGRSFGPSWASTLDQRVVLDGDQVRYLAADGSILTYPRPAEGEVVLPQVGRALPLRGLVGGGWLLTDPTSGRSLLFAPTTGTESLLTDVTDGGVRWSISRDDEGTPTRLRSSTGATIEFSSHTGLVTELRLPDSAGNLVTAYRFGYDGERNLIEVVNSSGDPARYDYADGRIVRWEDRNGEWYTYAYDEAGRCVRTDGKDGYLRYRLDYQDGLTVVTDSLGAVRRYEINDRFQVVAETDPFGATTRSEWDEAYRLLSRTDPLGRTTRYEYDTEGRPIAVTRPDGSRSTITYDEFGRATSWTDFDGSTRNREFDADGRVLAEIDAAGEVVRFDRPAEDGTAVQVGSTVTVRNAAWQITSTTTGERETRYEYDVLGRVVAVEDDRGVTSLGWTLEGELAWREHPDGSVEEFHYDGEGNLVESVDVDGRRTFTEYGAFDLVTARIDEDGNRTEYAYDTELRLTAITNPAGETWRYAYDANGRMIEETDFSGRTHRYAYDAAGQLTEHTNPAGEITYYAYDPLGRVVERRVGTTVTRLEYDAAGRIVAATDADSEIRLERDAEGRVVSETVNGRTVVTSYGERFGAVAARTRPSGTVTRWSYDDFGRPVVLVAGGRQVRFGHHDGFGRPAGGSEAPGDRTIDPGHRTIEPGGRPGDARYTFDALGRPVTRADATGQWRLTWDRRDRLIAVTTPDGEQWRYRYDAFDRRIAKQRHDAAGTVVEETEFVWSGDLLVEQRHRDQDGQVTTTAWEYHPAVAHPVAQITDGTVQGMVTDAADGRMKIVGIDGGHAGVPDTAPRLTGGWYLDAETGLRYHRSRYYDPATASFLPEPQVAPVPAR